MPTIIATCPEELTGLLASELDRLGATRIEPGHRVVEADLSLEQIYRSLLVLRTASRVLLPLGSVAAGSGPILYDQVCGIPWPELFDGRMPYSLEIHDGGGRGRRVDPIAATRLIEQALEESFRKAGGPTPRLRPDRPKVIISVFLRDDFCRLSLDLSGRSQHKRGYRLDGHPGPLKETLAAAVLSFAGYDGSQLLFDPMCGSGTLVIEGAFVALDKAPLIHRKKGQFGVEWLRGPWDPKRWRLVQDEARQTRRTQPAQPIIGSDINPDFIDLTRRCALRARVEKHLDLRVNDFFEADPPAESGLLVSNIPYGERVATPDRTLEEFYREIGRTLKQRYQGWTVALLVAEESPHRLIDLPPRQSVSLRNGGVPVCLLIFDPQ